MDLATPRAKNLHSGPYCAPNRSSVEHYSSRKASRSDYNLTGVVSNDEVVSQAQAKAAGVGKHGHWTVETEVTFDDEHAQRLERHHNKRAFQQALRRVTPIHSAPLPNHAAYGSAAYMEQHRYYTGPENMEALQSKTPRFATMSTARPDKSDFPAREGSDVAHPLFR